MITSSQIDIICQTLAESELRRTNPGLRHHTTFILNLRFKSNLIMYTYLYPLNHYSGISV